MSEYRFRNKDIETLTRDELLEALKQALQQVEALSSDGGFVWLPPEELARLQREKNAIYRATLDRLNANADPTPR